ncbi:hypothetical protein GFL39_26340 [Rhizobium leguminosarum bv. viciae]|uniref:hypothetical protein n=1 Tax=Rhizobium leguminosarum TaxID=384 RepID=UPI001442843D|nr:hypothetical protein [Rhizobium leguminosarum]NKL08392.1 hypothetical protein [Rhizobium leguminosarum bv. viciae]
MSDTTEPTSIWTQLKLDSDLVPFIVLTPQDITQLAELAACAEDPVAWLTDELHKRGRRRRDIKAAFKAQRMAEDARRIKDSSHWPAYPILPLKSQPWVTEANKGIIRFGYINEANRLIVMDKPAGKTLKVYASLEELVEEWSVD